MVHSHWSRSNKAWLSLVQGFIVLLRQCLLCHKEPAHRIQSPLLRACLLLPGSLCHKDSWLPCTERSYYRRPYAIKNQRGASKKPLVGGFLRSKAPSRGLWMRRAGSLWHKRHCINSSVKSSTSRWTTLKQTETAYLQCYNSIIKILNKFFPPLTNVLL